jgi:hypothetical protein
MDKCSREYAGGRVFNIQEKQDVFKNISNIKQPIMKRIIYTAVALIFCASVFGIADYYNTKNQGKLVNYIDEPQPAEAAIAEKKTEKITAIKEETVTSNAKKEIKKQSKVEKKVNKAKEPHYTAIVPSFVTETKEPVTEKLDPVNVVLQSKTTDTDDDSVTQASEKRKIKMEMFSRAPIREKKTKVK